jgi:hypothetical protein
MNAKGYCEDHFVTDLIIRNEMLLAAVRSPAARPIVASLTPATRASCARR